MEWGSFFKTFQDVGLIYEGIKCKKKKILRILNHNLHGEESNKNCLYEFLGTISNFLKVTHPSKVNDTEGKLLIQEYHFKTLKLLNETNFESQFKLFDFVLSSSHEFEHNDFGVITTHILELDYFQNVDYMEENGKECKKRVESSMKMLLKTNIMKYMVQYLENIRDLLESHLSQFFGFKREVMNRINNFCVESFISSYCDGYVHKIESFVLQNIRNEEFISSLDFDLLKRIFYVSSDRFVDSSKKLEHREESGILVSQILNRQLDTKTWGSNESWVTEFGDMFELFEKIRSMTSKTSYENHPFLFTTSVIIVQCIQKIYSSHDFAYHLFHDVFLRTKFTKLEDMNFVLNSIHRVLSLNPGNKKYFCENFNNDESFFCFVFPPRIDEFLHPSFQIIDHIMSIWFLTRDTFKKSENIIQEGEDGDDNGYVCPFEYIEDMKKRLLMKTNNNKNNICCKYRIEKNDLFLCYPRLKMKKNIKKENNNNKRNKNKKWKKKKKERLTKRRRCDFCKKEAENLMRCSKCKSVFYCGHICQKKDWKRHKRTCGKVL